MVWGTFYNDGGVLLVYIYCIIDQNVYKKILKDHVLHYVRKKIPRGWMFQQDNDPKHTSKMVTNWLIATKINGLAESFT